MPRIALRPVVHAAARIVTFCLVVAGTAAAQEADPFASAPFATEPAPGGPELRVLRDEPGAVTLELTADWPTTLDAAVDALDTRDAWRALLQLGAGHQWLSEQVDLGAAVPPPVEILTAEAERVTLPAGLDPEAVAAWRGAAAAVGTVGVHRRRLVGSVDLRPVVVDGGELVRYRRLVVRVPRPSVRAPLAPAALRGGTPTHASVTRSVLAEGTWFKVPVRREGVFRITAAYLRDSLGVAAPDLARVAVYGAGGRRVPVIAGLPRIPDLVEIPSLQTADAVLFFAEGPSWWDWRPAVGEAPGYWEHDIHPFSNDAYVFVRVDAPAPARLAPAPFLNAPDAVAAATVDARLFHEVDRYNHERDGGGSGLDWMGETLPRTSDGLVVLDSLPPGTDPGATVRYRGRIAARAAATTQVILTARGGAQATVAMGAIGLGSGNNGALLNVLPTTFEGTAGPSLGVSIRATGGPAGSLNWLDWLEAIVPHRPVVGPRGVLRFATPGGQTTPAEVALEGFATEPLVWDVTAPGEVRRLGAQADGGRWRVQVDGATTAQPREVVAFDPAGADVRVPRRGTPVANQNLHGETNAYDFLIVAHEDFWEQAQRLAEHRRTSDGLATLVVTPEQVANEFAGGTPDMGGIRDFAKMFYDRAVSPDDAPRYLLLFGDGHYDYRNLLSDTPAFVPVHQSENMVDRINSFTSDDFFGLLDDHEGRMQDAAINSPLREFVDLGVGRFTVTTPAEAALVVDKVIGYENPATRGAWRQRVTYVGDDQYPNGWDRDLHIYNADRTAYFQQLADSTVVVQKIYGPSYPELNAASGRRRPQATDAIVRALNEGTLVWNYSGHGGITGLGSEGYFTRGVLNRLTNADRLALFITATCSFGRFDMSERQSLAEETLLYENGGAVAMFTTVRIVYTSSSANGVDNFGLNVELGRQLVTRGADGRPRRLGDILTSTKQTTTGSSSNNRKFNLLGDPTMRIGLPEGSIALAPPPTLTAYEEATVTGSILTPAGQPDAAFDGEVEISVFDSERVVRLPQLVASCTDDFNLCQNTGGNYRVRTDRLYTGRATARAGQFSTTFRVPQDVSYSGQPARVVAYAVGAGTATAGGATSRTRVATTAGTRPDDATGPQIRLFLDDTTFVSGGLTRRAPTFLARLSDPSGINTVGASVGHELLLTIDNDPRQSFDVSRSYSGDLDTYRSGTVRFPLPELAPGPHTATLTAWDAVNNASTAEISFVVSDAEGLEVRNAFPYPNPTAGPTRFTFEHNQPAGTAARVQLRIFTLAGRPIRTLTGDDALPGGVLAGPLVQIPWDGRDDDGARLASGVYLYRLRVETDGADGRTQTVERVERLAIVR